MVQDISKAIKWYKLAADQGDSKANYNLGYLYEHGEGVEKDYNEALGRYMASVKNTNTNTNVTLWLVDRNKLSAEKMSEIRGLVFTCINSDFKECR